jgi:hypothetical protein
MITALQWKKARHLSGSAPPFLVNESEGTQTCSLRAQRTFCPLNFAATAGAHRLKSLYSGGILLNSILNGFGTDKHSANR